MSARTTQRHRRRRWLLVAWIVSAWVWAASPYWTRLADLGPAQTNDYFPTLDLVADESGWSTHPGDWLGVRSNEHRVILSTLLLRANVSLFDGDNRGLSAWALLMMATSAGALLCLLPPLAGRDDALPWALAAALILSFSTTTVAAENVAHGFSGTFWHTADALALLALAAAWRSKRRRGLFGVALLLGFAASWTYSTGLMVWPALALLAVARGLSRRRLGAILAVGAGVALASLLGYGRPGTHPDPNVGRDAAALVEYLEAFVGSVLATDASAAEAWGHVAWIVAVSVFGLAAGLVGRDTRSRLIWPWAAVAVYAGSNALVIAVGRSELGLPTAISSRYALLSALAWIALLVPVVLLIFRLPALRSDSGRRPLRWAVALWIGVVLIGLRSIGAARGSAELERYTDLARLQPAAHLALVHGIPDVQLYRLALTPVPEQLWDVRDELRALEHIPFDGTTSSRQWPQGALEQWQAAEADVGVLDGAFGVPGGWVRLQGWIPPSGRAVEEIVLVDAGRRRVGPAVYGTPRPRVAEEWGSELAFSGFIGYVRADAVRPRACVRFGGDPTFHCLVTSPKAQRRWPPAVASAGASPAL